MKDDVELLREYTLSHSEAAFVELVDRHINLVYSAALRQMSGDAHQAQDVTQIVFADLARKASRLLNHTSLSGWLYTSVRYAAASSRRSAQRRQQHEQEAHAMEELLKTPDSDADWEELKPILDDAMHDLREEDRHAVILRYFENKTLAEVGRALGTNENAARKRVERSVEKMRGYFGRRGALISAAALVGILTTKTVSAAPSSVAALITASTLTLAKTAVTTPTLIALMSITKTQIAAIVVGTAMIGTIAVQHRSNSALQQANQALTEQNRQIADLKAEMDHLKTNLAATRTTATSANMDELLSLRNQITQLQHKLADNRPLASASTSNNPEPPEPEDAVKQQEKSTAIRKMNNVQQAILAFIMLQDKYQDYYPTNIEASLSMLNIKDPALLEELTNRYELTYSAPWNTITNPATTVVIREKEPVQTSAGNWVLTLGFADGHCEIRSSKDGQFESLTPRQ
jgi:RNA polymerase sigma factor (sigma-70 family)